MSDLKIREVFSRDPLANTIPNDGVTKIIQPQTPSDWEVLRYEMESFVCEGEYRLGLDRILSAFLTNISQPQQQAVWVSGFYGSGKSHLVRVLEHLWRNVEFPDGARARSVATLPSDIDANLIELSRAGRQEGGLWSAAGKLDHGAITVRLALLAVLFRSAGLPEQYPAARLVLWLIQNGWYDAVSGAVQSQGKTLDAELRNMYVSSVLAESLLEVVPDLASNTRDIRALLREQYPNVLDISDDELHSSISDVLSLQSTAAGKLPLTLLVFDELQQFIGNDPERTLHVQNVVETCASRFGSHILFVGTGQSALQANRELSKLQGRFSIRVTLSDVDVEKVVREVVLRKAPDKAAAVKRILDASSGEIDRHLAGTRIGPRPDDVQDRVADYPILPVRRRLWERMLRSVDTAGAAGQLRTQLRIVHDTTRDVAHRSLGSVAPSDAIYWQIETEMQQSAILPRDVATMIRELDGPGDGKLRSRLCSLIFMIGKLPREEGPLATGVRATADVLADLLVDDLTVGSASLRQQVPIVLQTLVDDGRLILVSDEYRLQTPESIEWEADYRARLSRILADDVRMASERGTALRGALDSALKGLSFAQGASKTPRRYVLHFGTERPSTEGSSVPVWVQDEWSASERAVREEAQQAGVESPTVFVFLQRLEADELRQAIARLRAAEETVKTRVVPQTNAGAEAKASVESRITIEQQNLQALMENIVKNARVYQGGGNEVVGESFHEIVRQAVEAALVRLFPKFPDADQPGWNRVVTRAAQGAADPLSALGYTSGMENHPACQEVRSFVGGAGKRGADVRRHFSESPYGWSRDTVDGALLALLAGGFLRASRNGQAVTAKGMTQQQIGVTDFFSEGVTVSAVQRIEVRKLASGMGLPVKSGEEAEIVPTVLERLMDQAQVAGGEAPLPEPPDNTLIRELKELVGNPQIVGVAANADVLLARHTEWSSAGEAARERIPEWHRLETFLRHARDLPVVAELGPHTDAIRSERSLLSDPNPLPPLLGRATAALRGAVSDAHTRLAAERDREVAALEASDDWSQLKPRDRARIMESNGLGLVLDLDIGTDQALIDCLEETSLKDWDDRILALKARADLAREQAARLLAPKAVTVRPASATLKSREDVEAYVNQLKERLLAQIDEHPVIIP